MWIWILVQYPAGKYLGYNVYDQWCSLILVLSFIPGSQKYRDTKAQICKIGEVLGESGYRTVTEESRQSSDKLLKVETW